jgi:hypothetical protein
MLLQTSAKYTHNTRYNTVMKTCLILMAIAMVGSVSAEEWTATSRRFDLIRNPYVCVVLSDGTKEYGHVVESLISDKARMVVIARTHGGVVETKRFGGSNSNSIPEYMRIYDPRIDKNITAPKSSSFSSTIGDPSWRLGINEKVPAANEPIRNAESGENQKYWAYTSKAIAELRSAGVKPFGIVPQEVVQKIITAQPGLAAYMADLVNTGINHYKKIEVADGECNPYALLPSKGESWPLLEFRSGKPPAPIRSHTVPGVRVPGAEVGYLVITPRSIVGLQEYGCLAYKESLLWFASRPEVAIRGQSVNENGTEGLESILVKNPFMVQFNEEARMVGQGPFQVFTGDVPMHAWLDNKTCVTPLLAVGGVIAGDKVVYIPEELVHYCLFTKSAPVGGDRPKEKRKSKDVDSAIENWPTTVAIMGSVARSTARNAKIATLIEEASRPDVRIAEITEMYSRMYNDLQDDVTRIERTIQANAEDEKDGGTIEIPSPDGTTRVVNLNKKNVDLRAFIERRSADARLKAQVLAGIKTDYTKRSEKIAKIAEKIKGLRQEWERTDMPVLAGINKDLFARMEPPLPPTTVMPRNLVITENEKIDIQRNMDAENNVARDAYRAWAATLTQREQEYLDLSMRRDAMENQIYSRRHMRDPETVNEIDRLRKEIDDINNLLFTKYDGVKPPEYTGPRFGKEWEMR